MISPTYISEWFQQCPWVSPAQVEQNLILSRGLVEIHSDPVLSEWLLFRGGTETNFRKIRREGLLTNEDDRMQMPVHLLHLDNEIY